MFVIYQNGVRQSSDLFTILGFVFCFLAILFRTQFADCAGWFKNITFVLTSMFALMRLTRARNCPAAITNDSFCAKGRTHNSFILHCLPHSHIFFQHSTSINMHVARIDPTMLQIVLNKDDFSDRNMAHTISFWSYWIHLTLLFKVFCAETVWFYVTIERKKDWYENICTTLKWNLIRRIITKADKKDRKGNKKKVWTTTT